MLHLHLIAPPDRAARVVEYLTGLGAATNVVHLPGAALKPPGDVVLCDVAREEGSVVLSALRDSHHQAECSIAVINVDLSLSEGAREAERLAAGSAADAVLWEEVASRTSESSELSVTFLLFMVISTLIAAVGILTDSAVLVIGAMVVGPEFGPLAGTCVALVQRRLDLAIRSFVALAVGFPLAIALCWGATEGLIAMGIAPSVIAAEHPQTLFISRPDAYSAIVALVAGLAGMVSLTTAKSGALIGVFISVTTIPAAANIAVAAAYGNEKELRGAAAQLGINVAMILLAGVAALAVQRLAFVRRLRQSLRAARRRVAPGAGVRSR